MPFEFKEELYVESSRTSSREYQILIANLRMRLGVRSSHNRPALAVQEEPPTRFFELILRTNNHEVWFRLRMDNLYLIGYRMENGQWLEFNNNANVPIIPGSNFLGFDGSYGQLANFARQRLDERTVGSPSLETAINHLATVTDSETRARGLIVVIMMMCESTRLIPVYDYLASNYIGGAQIPLWMIGLVHSWGTLSAALLRADAYPSQSFQLPENGILIPPDRRIRTIAQAAEILGILLGLCFRGHEPRRSPRMAIDYRLCITGQPLLEVFSVRIDNIDDENPGELYGTIIVNDGLTTQYIYNRPRDNAESIREGDYATLTGPNQPVFAYGGFTIKVLLTDKDTWSWDDEIINEEISYNAYDIGNDYDKPIHRRLRSPRGSVSVIYAVLREAVAARVTIILEEGGENTAEVYGEIQPFCGNWGDNYNTRSILFKRASNDYISVDRQHNISLMRSIVAVPLSSSLKVKVNLKDYDPISGDDVIADGTEEFPAQMSGTFSKIIDGEDGNRVRVMVSWIFDI